MASIECLASQLNHRDSDHLLPVGRLAVEAAGRGERELAERRAVVVADHERALLEGPFAAGVEIPRAAAFRRDRAFAFALAPAPNVMTHWLEPGAASCQRPPIGSGGAP